MLLSFFFLFHFTQLFNLFTYLTFLLAYLRNVVEYGECEACEDKAKKEKESDDGLVHIPVLHVNDKNVEKILSKKFKPPVLHVA